MNMYVLHFSWYYWVVLESVSLIQNPGFSNFDSQNYAQRKLVSVSYNPKLIYTKKQK